MGRHREKGESSHQASVVSEYAEQVKKRLPNFVIQTNCLPCLHDPLAAAAEAPEP